VSKYSLSATHCVLTGKPLQYCLFTPYKLTFLSYKLTCLSSELQWQSSGQVAYLTGYGIVVATHERLNLSSVDPQIVGAMPTTDAATAALEKQAQIRGESSPTPRPREGTYPGARLLGRQRYSKRQPVHNTALMYKLQPVGMYQAYGAGDLTGRAGLVGQILPSHSGMRRAAKRQRLVIN
jgi:hypothetical protein